MTLEEKIKMLNDYAIGWYSSSQADYIHEAIFRAIELAALAPVIDDLPQGERTWTHISATHQIIIVKTLHSNDGKLHTFRIAIDT